MGYALQGRLTRGTVHRLALAKIQIKAKTLASRFNDVQSIDDPALLPSSSPAGSVAEFSALHSPTLAIPGVSFVGSFPDLLCSSSLSARTAMVFPLLRLSLPDAPRSAKRAHEDDVDDDERDPKKRFVREDSHVDDIPPDHVDVDERSADDKALDNTHKGFGVFNNLAPSAMGDLLKDLPVVSLFARNTRASGLVLVFEDEKKNRAEFDNCHLNVFEELAVLGILVDLVDITLHESLIFDQVDAIPQPLLLRARQLRIIFNGTSNSMLQRWYGPLLDMPNLERVVLQSAEPDFSISLPWKGVVHLLGTVIKHDPRRTRVERQGVIVPGIAKRHVRIALKKVAMWPDLLGAY